MKVPFKYNDGGREAAGFKGHVGDCVTRAITIATGEDYRTVYKTLGALNHEITGGPKSARDGLFREVWDAYLTSIGWKWTPTMKIGQGCTVHVRPDELPEGRLILRLSKHLVAFVDGVLHDTEDHSRGGNRCVYGYWSQS